jgi:hypothetical protein
VQTGRRATSLQGEPVGPVLDPLRVAGAKRSSGSACASRSGSPRMSATSAIHQPGSSMSRSAASGAQLRAASGLVTALALNHDLGIRPQASRLRVHPRTSPGPPAISTRIATPVAARSADPAALRGGRADLDRATKLPRALRRPLGGRICRSRRWCAGCRRHDLELVYALDRVQPDRARRASLWRTTFVVACAQPRGQSSTSSGMSGAPRHAVDHGGVSAVLPIDRPKREPPVAVDASAPRHAWRVTPAPPPARRAVRDRVLPASLPARSWARRREGGPGES